MRLVDETERSCPSSDAGQDEPRSTEVQWAKRQPRPGVAAIEYCLVLSLILVFVVIAVQNLGLGSKGLFQKMATIFVSDDANPGGDDDDDNGGKGKKGDDGGGKGKKGGGDYGKGKKGDGDGGKGKKGGDDGGKGKGKSKGKGKK